MQPILLLAIIGVAVAAVGAGFLTNDIDLFVQEFGAGETTINSPIDDAVIDFKIEKIVGIVDVNQQSKKVFKNVITQCIMKTDEIIVKDSTIICKLTDIDNNVVVEGDKLLQTFLPANTPTVIIIDDPTLKAKVDKIHDVILVVQGPKVTGP